MVEDDKDLKSFIHTKYEQLFSDWTTPLRFPSYLFGVKSKWNLMMFVRNSVYKNSDHCIYFYPDQYAIDGEFDGD